jgi:hypothetical protein
LENLSQVEADLNTALAPHLPGDEQTIEAVIESIQESVKRLRQSQSKEIFS